jgi:hypothetical protein
MHKALRNAIIMSMSFRVKLGGISRVGVGTHSGLLFAKGGRAFGAEFLTGVRNDPELYFIAILNHSCIQKCTELCAFRQFTRSAAEIPLTTGKPFQPTAV